MQRNKLPSLATSVSALGEVIKVCLAGVILMFVLLHWNYFRDWLSTVSLIKVSKDSFEVQRFENAKKVVAEGPPQSNMSTPYSREIAEAAITRAHYVSPVLDGALVLWVDDHPENNKFEVKVLSYFGIRFVSAVDNAEGIQRLIRDQYDLVITNVARPRAASDPEPLRLCPVVFSGWPGSDLPGKFHNDLEAFNKESNLHPIGGFSFIESVRARFGETAPPIIIYSAQNGDRVANVCAHSVTNRRDALLQYVVSALEESRWRRLVSAGP